jgi:hypothetical protein
VNAYHAVLEADTTVLEINGASGLTFRGFEFRHSGPGALGLLVYTSESNGRATRRLAFIDNIFHDSYDNDLMKLHDGTRSTRVRNNIFYNQGDGEEQIDVNSVARVTIEGNIFFNDFARSGRPVTNSTKHYITVKDSNEGSDGLLGSRHVRIRRNIFMNWEGDTDESFVSIGNDGKPFHEAVDVELENNLIIGDASNEIDTALSIAGARDVAFVNNTVVGDLPSNAYALRAYIKDDNPKNEDITLVNNIWSDPTGTMGARVLEDHGDFSAGDRDESVHVVLDRNLYWNGGNRIPRGEVVSPARDDDHRVVDDPGLASDQTGVLVPYWGGSSFLGGGATIAEEFRRIVEAYGAIPSTSAAVGKARRAMAPADDILGAARDLRPDLGAFEA